MPSLESREVRLTTVHSTLLRFDARVDTVFRTEEPYSRITNIQYENTEVILPDLGPTDDPPGEVEEYTLHLPRVLVERLLAYAATRLYAEHISPGNCHDFTCYMSGLDTNRIHATKILNKLLPTATQLEEEDPIQPGSILLIGNPSRTHTALGPLVHGRRDPDYSDNGHGPLQICHSGIGTMNTENSPYVLHRVALEGPLGISPPSGILQAHRELLSKIRPEDWEMGRSPDPAELHLYSADLARHALAHRIKHN